MPYTPRPKPAPWPDYREALLHGWELPIFAVQYVIEWIVYYLGRWGLLRILEYSGMISVMFGVFVYFREAPDRQKQKHYQAWQVINTAQGKGGSGGRIEAMQELNADKIALTAVDVSGAVLQGVRLPNAMLLRADLDGTDLRNCFLEGADLDLASLVYANFRDCNLRGVHMKGGNLENVDMFGTDLAGADISNTFIKDGDLRFSELKGVKWENIRSIEGANIFGIKNAPTTIAMPVRSEVMLLVAERRSCAIPLW